MLTRKRRLAVAVVACLVVAPLLVIGRIAQAHGGVEVGDYELTIGFRNEPAYAGELNGLDLRVMSHNPEADEDHGHAEEEHSEEGEDHTHAETPVSGLEQTLRVEIIHGSASRELELRPVFGEAGSYTADVLPVAPGDYTFHIWGEIEDTPVDVEMTSGPGTFSPVLSKDEAAFPAAEPSTEELAGQTRFALYTGIVGIVLGLAGTVLGILGLRRRV